uniref:Uncharacterized protein n=1 Tax=Anguilla anguilla TaxID=7936 RepID=A0A0E9V0U1_ANGAN
MKWSVTVIYIFYNDKQELTFVYSVLLHKGGSISCTNKKVMMGCKCLKVFL